MINPPENKDQSENTFIRVAQIDVIWDRFTHRTLSRNIDI